MGRQKPSCNEFWNLVHHNKIREPQLMVEMAGKKKPASVEYLASAQLLGLC
jgi:hypothetical protein